LVNDLLLWTGFLIIVFGLLAFDLGVFQRRSHAVGMKEAIIMTIFWIFISLIFGFGIYAWFGADKSFEFFTAYIVEKSLSVDNLFVFMVIFAYFNVDLKYQHKILFYGIIGALITRGIFIFTGITLINMFHYAIYIFGIFLIYTGLKLLKANDDEKVNPSQNFVLKHVGKYLPIKKDYIGGQFIVKDKYNYFFTPIFIVLLVIETTDVMFAFDSVPAVLSITRDPFIVYTSNIFAILGLSRGSVYIEHLNKFSHTISTHTNHLSAIALNTEGDRIATTSERGTIVRLYNTIDGELVREFRRGLDTATITHRLRATNQSPHCITPCTIQESCNQIVTISRQEPTSRLRSEKEKITILSHLYFFHRILTTTIASSQLKRCIHPI